MCFDWLHSVAFFWVCVEVAPQCVEVAPQCVEVCPQGEKFGLKGVEKCVIQGVKVTPLYVERLLMFPDRRYSGPLLPSPHPLWCLWGYWCGGLVLGGQRELVHNKLLTTGLHAMEQIGYKVLAPCLCTPISTRCLIWSVSCRQTTFIYLKISWYLHVSWVRWKSRSMFEDPHLVGDWGWWQSAHAPPRAGTWW